MGYERILRRATLGPDPDLVALGAHGRYQARELAAQLLSARHRPTAIFAASDTQALGVIAAAHEAGLRVPEDLSIVGYDDVEIADHVGLTTVRQGLFESGRVGAELLLAEIRERSAEPPRVVLAPELVVRGTTAPPKEGRA
jgi:DNA-binding LacI/PurR family transcriptional regulator